MAGTRATKLAAMQILLEYLILWPAAADPVAIRSGPLSHAALYIKVKVEILTYFADVGV